MQRKKELESVAVLSTVLKRESKFCIRATALPKGATTFQTPTHENFM